MNAKKTFHVFMTLFLLVASSACKPSNISSTSPSETPGGSLTSTESVFLPVIQDQSATDASAAEPQTNSSSITPTIVSNGTPVPGSEITYSLDQTFKIDEPSRLVWMDDQSSFALVSYNRLAYYRYPSLELIEDFTFSDNEALVDVSPDGETYALKKDDENLYIMNWKTGDSRQLFVDFPFVGGEYSADGILLLLEHMDRIAVTIIDVETGSQTLLDGFETAAPVYTARFGADGKHIIWLARATLQLGEIATNTLGPAVYHQDFVSSFDLSPDGQVLVSSAATMIDDNFVPVVFFWDTQTGEKIAEIVVDQPVYSMSVSPDGEILAASTGSIIQLISMTTYVTIGQMETGQESITQLAYSPAGDILACVSSEQEIQFWVQP